MINWNEQHPPKANRSKRKVLKYLNVLPHSTKSSQTLQRKTIETLAKHDIKSLPGVVIKLALQISTAKESTFSVCEDDNNIAQAIAVSVLEMKHLNSHDNVVILNMDQTSNVNLVVHHTLAYKMGQLALFQDRPFIRMIEPNEVQTVNIQDMLENNTNIIMLDGANSSKDGQIIDALRCISGKITHTIVKDIEKLKSCVVLQLRPVVSTKLNIQLIEAEGLQRVQSLLAIIFEQCMNQGKSIVIWCVSKSTSVFVFEMLLALNDTVLPEVFCCDVHDAKLGKSESILKTQESFKVCTERKLLITSCNNTPIPGANLYVQYESVPLSTIDRNLSHCVQYASQLVLFMHTHEVRTLVPILHTRPLISSREVAFSTIPLPPISLHKVTIKQLLNSVRDSYMLQMSAYSAFRSYLQSYNTAYNTAQINVRCLTLDQVAMQFGLSSVPLIDLHLEDNAFRLKSEKSGRVYSNHRHRPSKVPRAE